MDNYFTYIIESIKWGKYYTGQTNNLETRLKKHNSGKNRSTKPYLPWRFVYKKGFCTRSEAVKHERYLKSIKSREQLNKIINAG